MEDPDCGDFLKLGGSLAAIKKRNAQLESWKNSVTNQQPDYIIPTRSTAKVKFGNVDAFLGAVKCGDTEEVRRILEEKAADVNTRNSDHLTALHQTCIEGDLETTRVLIEHGADVNVQDIDGWTPLHGAASCGHTQIVRVLLDNNAFPAIVSYDGKTPSDLVEDNDIILNMLREKVEEEHIDIEALKNAEENAMMEDALKMKEDSSLSVVGTDGVTPLHVAAAKGYTNVLKILLSLSSVKSQQLDAEDQDGWTPLHAAVFWGNMDVAEQLVQSGADLMRMTRTGDTVDDLCDPDCRDELENLKKLADKGDGSLLGSSYHGGSPLDESRLLPPVITRSFSRETPPSLMRRRMSKEVVMLDMSKEREEREMFSPEVIEEVDLPNGHPESQNGEPPVSTSAGKPLLTTDGETPTISAGNESNGGPAAVNGDEKVTTPRQRRWETWSYDDDDTNGVGNTSPVNGVNSDLSNGAIDTSEKEGTSQEDIPLEDSAFPENLPDEFEPDSDHVTCPENSLPVVSENGVEELLPDIEDDHTSAEDSSKDKVNIMGDKLLERDSDHLNDTSRDSSTPENDDGEHETIQDAAMTGEDSGLMTESTEPPLEEDLSVGKDVDMSQAVDDNVSSQAQQQATVITEPSSTEPFCKQPDISDVSDVEEVDESSTTEASSQQPKISPFAVFLLVAAMAVVVGVLIRQAVTS